MAAKTILIIEDDAGSRILYERLLKSCGYSAIACENGSQGLAILREQKPGAVITDYDYDLPPAAGPEMNGYVFARLARQSGYAGNIGMMTSSPKNAIEQNPDILAYVIKILEKPPSINGFIEFADLLFAP